MIHSTLLQLLSGEFITSSLIITVIAFFCFDFWKKHWRRQLPGPINAPFLGYVPFLYSSKPHELLYKLRKDYGSIFGFHVGERYVVVLNDIKAIRETLNREEFLARPYINPMNLFEKNSIVVSKGPIWKQEKRLALRIFHELGFGRNVMEERVKDEISYFMKRLEEREGNPFSLRRYLYESINNNISSLIFGQRFDYDDPIGTSLTKTVEEFDNANPNIDIKAFFPYLSPIIRVSGMDPTLKSAYCSDRIAKIISNEMSKAKRQLGDETTRSYLHGYLLQIEKDKGQTTLTEEALVGTAKALYIAGLSTTVNTMEWLLLTLSSNRKVQERVQQEIDEVVSRKGRIDWSDQKTMTYTRAVILEIMRWRTLLPLSVPRCASIDTTIQGYTVPRGTIVFTNIWAAHNDHSIWESPEEFNPERFLNKEGKLINTDFCVPFSVGRRSCPGESLAQLQILLYCANILGKYHVSLAKEDVPTFGGIPLFICVPQSFKILLKPRMTQK